MFTHISIKESPRAWLPIIAVLMLIALIAAFAVMGYKIIEPIPGVTKITLRLNNAASLSTRETDWLAWLGIAPTLIITDGDGNISYDGLSVTGEKVGISEAYISVFGRKWKRFEIGVIKQAYTAVARGNWASLNEAFAEYDFSFDFERVNAYGTRAIRIEPGWEKQNIVGIPFLYFESLRINRRGMTAFEGALRKMLTTTVTVHYLNGARTFFLSELVKKDSASGAYTPRYINAPTHPADEPNVSVHSWGFALDLNVSFSVNGQTANNWPKLNDAISRLKWLSTTQEEDLTHVELRYSGAQPTGEYPVPEAAANYLLYELAFADCGFFWGGYFTNTDGMHFSLVEKPARARITLKKT